MNPTSDGNGEFNVVFEPEIEQKLATRPITEMPSFEPRITPQQVEQITVLTESERRIVTPIIMAMSVIERMQEWQVRHIIHLTGVQRTNELKDLRRMKGATAAILWITTTALGSVAAAWAMRAFHVL